MLSRFCGIRSVLSVCEPFELDEVDGLSSHGMAWHERAFVADSNQCPVLSIASHPCVALRGLVGERKGSEALSFVFGVHIYRYDTQ